MKKLRKSKSKSKRARSTPKVRKVVLPPAGIVRVAIPSGVVPVVAVDPVRKVVEIVPVKATERGKKGFWRSLWED